MTATLSYRPPSWLGSLRGCACFTWDDGYDDHYAVGALADARGQKHTFNVYSDGIDAGGRLTSAQILSLYNRGHEIASHSKTHPASVPAQSAANRLTEYTTSLSALEAIVGSGNVKTFTYPSGAFDATTDAELYGRYDRVLTISGLNVPHTLPVGYSFFRAARLAWTPSSHEQVLDLIRYARVNPVVVLTYAHDIDTDGSVISTSQVTEALDLAYSLDVPCFRACDVLGTGTLLTNPGFENGLYGWQTVATGTGSAAAAADTPDTNLAGSYSAKLTCADSSSSVYLRQMVPVRAGDTYTFSGRYRKDTSAGAGSITVRLAEYDITGTQVAATSSSALTSASWASFSLDRAATTAATHFMVDAVLQDLTGDAYFDHLHFNAKAGGALG